MPAKGAVRLPKLFSPHLGFEVASVFVFPVPTRLFPSQQVRSGLGFRGSGLGFRLQSLKPRQEPLGRTGSLPVCV